MARRVRKWIKRGVLGLLALIVVVIGVVLIAIHTDTGRALIASQVAKVLHGAFPGGAKIGKIEGSPFGELVVYDIELNGPDGKPFIKIDKVEAEITIRALVHGTVHVDRVHADGVTVTNPRPPGPPKPPEPGSLEIELPNITVEHANVVLDDTPQGKIELVDTNIFAALHLSSGWGPVGIFASIDGRWAQRDAKVSAMVQLQLGDQIEVPFASVTAGGVSVYVAGIATGKDMNQPAGKILISAPKSAVAKLLPGVELPDDARISIDASTKVPPKGVPASTVAFSGTLGTAKVDGVFQGELSTLSARGSLAVSDADIAVISGGRLPGHASTAVFVSVEKGHLHAAVATKAQVMQFAPVSVVANLDATPDNVHGMVLATGAGGLRVVAAGGLNKDGGVLALSDTHVGIEVADASAASGGLAPVRGAVDVEAQVAGEFDDLAVTGKVLGTRLRMNTLGIARVSGSFAGRIGKKPIGIARLSVDGVTNNGSAVGDADVDATVRPDRTIGVVATAHAAAVQGTVEIAANVSLGDAIEVALSSHKVTLPVATWSGTGGHVHIGDDAIIVKDFHTASGESSLSVDASMTRASGALSADIEAKDISLAMIDPSFKGLVGAKLEISNHGINWKGTGLISARNVVIDPAMKPLDAAISLGVDGRHVDVAVKASNADVGGLQLALSVEGPRDLTDAVAWQRLGRDDLHALSIGFDKLNLVALTNGKAPGGMLDGTLAIKGGSTDKVLAIDDFPTPLGAAHGTISLALDDAGGLDVTADGEVGTLGGAKVSAKLLLPEHPFAPLEWKKLGINALHSATVETSDIAVTPALMQQLGIDEPMSGHLAAKVTVGAGLSSVDANVNLTKITGGPLLRPADLSVAAHVDDAQTTAEVHLVVADNKLLDITDTHVPVSLDQWLADPKAALNAKFASTLTIRTSFAKTILAAIGRNDVETGTFGGSVTFGGTLRAPTAHALIDLTKIAVRQRLAGRSVPELSRLHVDANWDGHAASLQVTGEEAPARGEKDATKGLLNITLDADVLTKAVKGRVAIANFELSPLAAFLPGPLVAASGKLDSDLTITGLDPTAGDVNGFLELKGARLPLAAVLGNLRDASVRIDIDKTQIAAKVNGKVGSGTFKLDAKSDPKGLTTNVTATVSKLSPIGFLQPQIDGTAKGSFKRDGLFWKGNMTVSNARVFIPEARGNALLDSAVPIDLVFIDEPAEEREAEQRKLGGIPEKPFLVADITIESTKVEIPSFQPALENGSLNASGSIELSVGESVGMDGTLSVDRGEVDIFGRRYTLDYGTVAFDGAVDPYFNIRLTHEYSDITTHVRVKGRPSEIDSLTPELTSEPGTYSQGQLFGFLLGGNPSADAGSANQSASYGVGSAIASSQIKSRVLSKNSVTKQIDVLRCDPGIGSTGTSCTLGKYVTENFFVGVVYRTISLINENTVETQGQYTISTHWLLSLIGGGTAQGGDVLYRKRF
ncbi:MAG TPA: translocation/assembly module TamB domain-containing protein [Kofleriaceae bacterium]|jgi:hypothetical protein